MNKKFLIMLVFTLFFIVGCSTQPEAKNTTSETTNVSDINSSIRDYLVSLKTNFFK